MRPGIRPTSVGLFAWIVGLLVAALPILAASHGMVMSHREAREQDTTPPELRLLRHRPLPKTVTQPRDVRWIEDQRLLVSSHPQGLVEVDLASETPVPAPVIAGKNEAAGIWMAYHVALAGRRVATAGPLFSFAWKERSPDAQLHVHPLATIMDFDLHGNRALLLGGRRGPEGAWCPDSAIAWTMDLDQEAREGNGTLEPVFFSQAPQAKATMGMCGVLHMGAVRFLEDGTFLVIPGVEDGVRWHRVDGQLLFTWTAEEVGFFSGCPLDALESRRLHKDEEARYRWLDQRPTVEDVIPLGREAGVVIRHHSSSSGTRWELVRLSRDGSMARFRLPFEGSRPYAHVRGDSRGDQLVFLEYGGLDGQGALAAAQDPTTNKHPPAEIYFVEAPR